ncbi:FAD-dependent oxidoreductase [Streptomyces sp. NPDC056716]|uniref:FAD-dependent oxidoreductase n=1 Tax=unclassified Streptomyces TaxID=2593676 RepID=UPI00369AEAAE
MTDFAVIGAGPAGLAAALAAAARGVRVTLLDSAPTAGGQFYRQPAPGLGARRPQALHHQWRTWERLRDGLARQTRIGHLADHHVWSVEAHPADGGFTVHALLGPAQDHGTALHADAVLLATGGYEQVLPFPGWTLPGVVTAGGAQAMLKGGLVLPGRTVVVAGTGPLLLPVATGLAAAGARVAALVESADPRNLVRQARADPRDRVRPVLAHPRDLLRHALALAPKAPEAAAYAAALLRHRVPVLPRHTIVAAHGRERVEAVTVSPVTGGPKRRIPCDTLAVSHGMLPHTDLADALGCGLDGPYVRVDDEQRTDVPGVWAAGETTGIGGAALALAEGHLAGRSIAARLAGRKSDPGPDSWRGAAKTRTRKRRFTAALDRVYTPPPNWPDLVTDETVLCRCEDVTAGAVREAVGTLGAGDLRTVKLLTRAGMGWCQGRMCAAGVAGVAGCASEPVRRLLARPVPLGVLARDPDHADTPTDQNSDSGSDSTPNRPPTDRRTP